LIVIPKWSVATCPLFGGNKEALKYWPLNELQIQRAFNRSIVKQTFIDYRSMGIVEPFQGSTFPYAILPPIPRHLPAEAGRLAALGVIHCCTPLGCKEYLLGQAKVN
jgi:hypothetical protein